ncbi:hypothetical protein J2X69_002367 [Algoriphagus sp. 4150]|nr:hypothetical protein [Algoriphagus sp. 4150]
MDKILFTITSFYSFYWFFYSKNCISHPKKPSDSLKLEENLRFWAWKILDMANLYFYTKISKPVQNQLERVSNDLF